MKLLLLAAALAAVDADKLQAFESWKETMGKTDDPGAIPEHWDKNYQLVSHHNRLADAGVRSHRLALTRYADTDLEARRNVTCLAHVHPSLPRGGSNAVSLPSWISAPPSIDWRQLGYVTAVKDQGPVCESCWAFSAVGALEGQHFAKTGRLVSLSEQQLVDCSQAFGNRGCNRGLPSYAFNYIRSSGGIQSDLSYPYNARDNTCTFNPRHVVEICSGIVNVPFANELALRDIVAIVGPVTALVDASHPSWALYGSGVYDEPNCSSTQVTHAVVIVGYGTYQGRDFWLVKNSAGIHWGINGYIMMSRNKNNQCGIASYTSYPLV